MASDRVFGFLATVVALIYIMSAAQIQTSFMTDPVGPKGFPILIGVIWAVSAMYMVFKPDEEPRWPGMGTFFALGCAVIVLLGYALALKPLGFLVPTSIAAAILSFQISPKAKNAILTGIGLSAGLFIIFKYALGLGLVPFPRGLF